MCSARHDARPLAGLCPALIRRFLRGAKGAPGSLCFGTEFWRRRRSSFPSRRRPRCWMTPRRGASWSQRSAGRCGAPQGGGRVDERALASAGVAAQRAFNGGGRHAQAALLTGSAVTVASANVTVCANRRCQRVDPGAGGWHDGFWTNSVTRPGARSRALKRVAAAASCRS